MRVTKRFMDERFGEIRTFIRNNDEPWFVGKDVAKALGYSNPINALIAHVDEEDKTTTLIQGSGSNYKSTTTLINESGLYALILSSKLAKAREFKRWVTSVVLPQIRKTGGFIPAVEGDTEEDILARTRAIFEKTIEEKNAQLLAQRPLVQFAEDVMKSSDTCTVAELAKLIYGTGDETGQNRLFAWLRDHNYLGSTKHHWNIPLQVYIEQGLFEVKVSQPWYDRRGETHYNMLTLVTPKGQQYFINLFKTAKAA